MISVNRNARRAVLVVLLAVLVAGLSGWDATSASAQGIGDKIKCEKINADRKVAKAQLGQLDKQIESLEKLQKSANRSQDEQTKAEKDLAKATQQHKKLTAELKKLDKEADKAKCK